MAFDWLAGIRSLLSESRLGTRRLRKPVRRKTRPYHAQFEHLEVRQLMSVTGPALIHEENVTGGDFSDSESQATVIRPGQSVAGAIQRAGDADHLQFSAKAGTAYRIELTETTLADARIVLAKRGGEAAQVENVTDADGRTRLDWVADRSGAVIIQIEAANPFATGSYSLQLSTIADDVSNEMRRGRKAVPGQSFAGTLEYRSDADWFRLSARRGATYTLNVASVDVDDLRLVVVDSSGKQELASSSIGRGESETVEWTATRSATVRFRVDSTSGATGRYEFQLDRIEDDHSDSRRRSTLLKSGRPVSGDIQFENDVDWFRFKTRRGKAYRIQVQAEDLTSGRVVVHSAGARKQLAVKSIQQGETVELVLLAGRSGTHYVSVAPADASARGRFTIEAGVTKDDYASVSNRAKRISTGQAVQGRLEFVQDEDWFRLTARPGKVYRVQLTGLPAGAAEVSVYNRTGRVKVAAATVDATGAARLDFVPNRNGRWLIRVAGSSLEPLAVSPAVDAQNYELLADVVSDDHGNAPSQATRLDSAQPLQGRLETSLDQDWFRATLGRDSRYRFSLEGVAAAGITLRLVDRDGATTLQDAVTDSQGRAELIYESTTAQSVFLTVLPADPFVVADYSVSFRAVKAEPVNTSPTVSRPLSDITVPEDSSPGTIDLTGVFSDAEDTELALAVESDREDIVRARLEDRQLELELAGATGTARITVTATDSGGLFVSETMLVTVQENKVAPPANSAPQLRKTFEPVALRAGDSIEFELTEYFADPEGETLEFSASTGSGAPVTTEITDGRLMVKANPGSEGATTIRVTVSDSHGASVTTAIPVRVGRFRVLTPGEFTATPVEGTASVNLGGFFGSPFADSDIEPVSYSILPTPADAVPTPARAARLTVLPGGPTLEPPVLTPPVITPPARVSSAHVDGHVLKIPNVTESTKPLRFELVAHYHDGSSAYRQIEARFQIKGGISQDVYPDGSRQPGWSIDVDEVLGAARDAYDTVTSVISAIKGFFKDSNGKEYSLFKRQNRKGSDGPDRITTGYKKDTVHAREGNDVVDTKAGPDFVSLGKGNDVAYTGKGADTVQPGEGDDFVYTGKGKDVIEASPGNDLFYSGKGNDTINFSGEWGNDQIIDPSTEGRLTFDLPLDQLTFTQNGNSLEIGKQGSLSTVMLHDVFGAGAPDRSGWKIATLDPLGGPSQLHTVLNRDAASNTSLAVAAYHDDGKFTVPDGMERMALNASTGNSATGFRAHALRKTGTNDWTIAIAGTDFLDKQSRLSLNAAGFPQSRDLSKVLREAVAERGAQSIQLVTHSQGFAVAEWSIADIRRNFPQADGVEISLVGYNGVSSGQHIPGYLEMNLPKTSIVNYVNPNDIAPGLGMPAGNPAASLHPAVEIRVVETGGQAPDYGDTFLGKTEPGDPIGFWSSAPHADDGLKFKPNHDVETLDSALQNGTAVIKLTPEEINDHFGHLHGIIPDRSHAWYESPFNLQPHQAEIDSIYGRPLQSQPGMLRRLFFPAGPQSQVSSRGETVRFDFGTQDSPLAPEHLRVTPAETYSASRGWGWNPEYAVAARDRGEAGDIERDLVVARKMEFLVDLPAGSYDVTLTVGDDEYLRQKMLVSLDGYGREFLLTYPHQFVTKTYRINHDGGQLRVGLKDFGGSTRKAVLNGLEIERVDPWAAHVENSELRKDAPIIVLTHGWTRPKWIDDLIRIGKFVKYGYELLSDIHTLGVTLHNPLGFVEKTKAVVEGVKSVIKDVQTIQKLAKEAKNSRVADWTFLAARELARSQRRLGLPRLNSQVLPIKLDDIQARNDGRLMKLWKASPDFLILDWTKESNDGTGVFDLFDFDEKKHRRAVQQAAGGIKRMIEARIRQLRETDPGSNVDILFVGHSFGASVNRDVVTRLNRSDLADAIDFVKAVELDPVAMERDELKGTAIKSDKFYWYHPELTGLVDAVTNYYQTEGLGPFNIIERQLHLGKPLDGNNGGGPIGFYNRQGRVWDVDSGDEFLRFRHWDTNTQKLTSGALTDIEYSPDGTLIASSGEDRTVSVRDALTGEIRFTIYGHKKPVKSVAFIDNGRYLATLSGQDGALLLTEISDDPQRDGVSVWKGEHEHGFVVGGSESGEWLASGGKGGNIRIWRRIENGPGYELLQIAKNHRDRVRDIEFLDDGTLITSSDDGTFRIWQQGEDGQFNEVDRHNMSARVRGLAYDPASRRLAVASGSKVTLWNLSTAGILTLQKTLEDHVDKVQSVAISRDGRRLFTGGMDRTIFAYDMATLHKINVLSNAMLPVRELASNPEGTRLAVVGYDRAGGPVSDHDVTDNAESRVGFHWTDLFGGTGREHDEIPLIYIDDVLKRRGEPFFWRRDNPAAGRPNDEIDKSRNHALPPHKRNGTDGIDLVDMQLHTRPGNNIEFLPRRFIIGANRSDFSVTSFTQPANGRIERKKKYPNVLIYKPNDGFTGKDVFTLTLTDKEGNSLTTTGTANVENNAPTALDDTTEAWWGQTMEIFPKRNDWDVNGDAFNVVEVSAARLGKVRQKKGHPNILVYTAPAGHNDTDEFTYRMKDRFGATTTATVRVMLKEPAARENVHHTDVLRFKATVAWDKVDWKADAYRIVFVGKEKNGRIVNGINPSKNSKVVDNLDPDTEYTVRVDAKRKSGLWIEGGTTTFRTLQHTGPANVGHKDVLRVKATVTWDKVDWKAAAYRIVFIGPEKNGHIVNGIDASRSQKEVDGLEAGKTYEVRVDARRQNGAWVLGDANTGTTTFTTAEFTGPGNVGHKDVLRVKATVTWGKVDWKAAAYRIVFIGPEKNGQKIAGIDSSKSQKVIDNLEPGKTYEVRVDAKRHNGEWVPGVAPGGTTKFTTKEFTGPNNVGHKDVLRIKATITWNKVDWKAAAYRIVFIGPEKNGQKITGIDASRSQKVIDDLEPETTYRVRVDAKRQNGAWVEGIDPSGTTEFTTGAFVGPQGVGHKDVKWVKATVTWQKVEWKADAYRLVFVGGPKHDQKIGGISENASQKDVDNLEDGIRYTIRVDAKRRNGEWVQGGSTSFTTQTFTGPTGVRIISRRTDRLTVSWNRVAWQAVRYRAVIVGGSKNGQTFGAGSATTVVVNGLASGTRYTIRVEALRKNGQWVDGDQASDTTQTATGPSGVSHRDRSFSKVTIVWNPGNFGARQQRIVYTGGPKTGKVVTVGAGQRSKVLDGLDPGTSHTVRVDAQQANGQWVTGGSTAFSTLRLDGPQSVNRRDVKETSATITWNRVAWNAGKYRVYIVSGPQAGKTYGANSSLSQKTIDGLKEDSHYVVRVDAQQKGKWVHGTTTSFRTLKRQGPQNVGRHSIKATQATITWNRVSWNAAKYRVTILSGPGAGKSFGASSGFSSKTITGLTHDSSYVVRVDAQQQNKKWVEGASTSFGTEKLDGPEGVAHREVKKKKATITWNRVSWNVKKYRVYIVSGPGAGKSFGASSNYSSRTIDGLKPGRNYTVRVDAEVSNGKWVLGRTTSFRTL